MSLTTVIIIGFGLAMDAFATSVSNGICLYKSGFKHASISALFFGLFQGIMPLLGWTLGVGFSDAIRVIDHWIAFVLLCYIGISMIRQTYSQESGAPLSTFNYKNLLIMAVATSIDALITGVTFAFTGITSFADIILSITVIFLITFFMCLAGFYIGRFFGAKWKKHACLLGGCILILMGIKILIEHL